MATTKPKSSKNSKFKTTSSSSSTTSALKAIKDGLIGTSSTPTKGKTETHAKGKSKEKKSVEEKLPTLEEFMANSDVLPIQIGKSKFKELIELDAKQKIMSTGSFGWSGNRNGKITLKDGKKVDVSISVNVVVQNSNPNKPKTIKEKKRKRTSKGAKGDGSSSSSSSSSDSD